MAAIDSERRSPEAGKEMHATRLLQRRRLSETAFEISLTKPDGYAFTPGQHLILAAGNLERAYSILSGPADPNLHLIIREVPEGGMSRFLARENIGAPLALSKAAGHFTFRPSPRPPVFIATGTGIAPYVAMARAGISRFLLLHGVRKAQECYYAEELIAAAATYIPCLSEDATGREPAFSGRVTSYIATRLAAGAYDFYLCGSSAMIRDATLLIDKRFPGSRIYSERFH
ncbi:MAG: ferredoxin--NADP reductase [Thermodesulfobacteriota bacterium]